MDFFFFFFHYFSLETGFDISGKISPMDTVFMKCQLLFSGNNKQNILNLASAEFAQTGKG